jgi:hypothetical protein
VEALGLTGFRATRVIPRLLPYGANPAGRIRSRGSGSALGRFLATPEVHRAILATYLRLRPAWRLFGGQMFVVAIKD